MVMTTANRGTWKIFGLNIIPTDSIFSTIKEAIDSGNLSQSYLQKYTGHLAPITFDLENHYITFHRS